MSSSAWLGRPPVSFVKTPRGSVGYQVFGSGDRDIVFISHWATNLDMFWEEPSAARFLDRLGGMGRVILIDKLGAGVSDTPVGLTIPPVEDTLDDIRDVLGEVGVQKPVLVGDTEGGFVAMALAAFYPEQFPSLILLNSYARLRWAEDYQIGAEPERVERWAEAYMRNHGRTGRSLELTAPSAAEDSRFVEWFIRFSRSAQSQRIAADAVHWIADTDVRAVLPAIQAETLVIHRRGARYHRLDYGKYLADHIPGARLAIVEGADTLPFHAGDFGPTLDLVEEFITGDPGQVTTDRMLSTVMFTDIVGSTALAAEVGDERWLDVRDSHDRMVKETVDRYRGELVDTTGDGALATFDGPQRAVLCALAIRDSVRKIGLSIRVGIHTGEVELRRGGIGGIAVHIAARVMHAVVGEGVFVSRTVKDLVVGSPLRFQSRGQHELKGVPGTWDLYEALI